MEADFSGWATKNNIKCSDGRVIMPNAFAHDDQPLKVPLVWQHCHNDPENVLGHAILENRPEGVYAYGYFNASTKAMHTRGLLEHDDINMMSIHANNLMEKAKQVLHGVIREVSLVLSAANPGARIENVAIRHSDGDIETLDDDVIIFMGIELEHEGIDGIENLIEGGDEESKKDEAPVEKPTPDEEEANEDDTSVVEPTPDENKDDTSVVEPPPDENKDEESDDNKSDETPDDTTVSHAVGDEDETIADILDTLNEKQKNAMYFVIGDAIEAATEAAASAEHSDINHNTDNNADNGKKGTGTMGSHNVFEKDSETNTTTAGVLSHSDMTAVFEIATKSKTTLRDALETFLESPAGLEHGITDIDTLFPEARNLTDVPEYRKRRTEWVDVLLGGVRKSPFSNIKTLSADLTYEDARAKGYVTGALKKEEYFPVATRTTLPTTIYKKQKLDRDDLLDITDFDVVAWLKGEMRIMLDEELARAILVSDGRAADHEDKINEAKIRPIAKDDELYTTTVNVNIGDASSSVVEIVDALIMNRKHLRGSGLPIMFTTETYIALFMLLKDSTGRRIYRNLDELASELRVSSIVAVEVMEEDPDTIAVLVNPIDYVLGANKGGNVTMFDDFNIDYNKHLYLIETRCSGALVKLKSAIVVKKVASNVTLVTPQAPTFNSNTGVVTIPTQTGVTYKDADDNTISAGAMAAIAAGATVTIYSVPSSSSYAFNNNEEDQWDFTREAS